MGHKSKEIGKEAKELTIKIYEEGKAHAHIAELLDVIRKFQSTGSVKNILRNSKWKKPDWPGQNIALSAAEIGQKKHCWRK